MLIRIPKPDCNPTMDLEVCSINPSRIMVIVIATININSSSTRNVG